MSEAKLKACPWCGDLPAIRRPFAPKEMTRISCVSSRCKAWPHVVGDTMREAEGKWNARAGREPEAEPNAGNIAGSVSANGSVTPLIEQWRFPLGGHTAVLTITGESELEPEDIDALLEISLLFKRQVMMRHQLRAARTAAHEYEI